MPRYERVPFALCLVTAMLVAGSANAGEVTGQYVVQQPDVKCDVDATNMPVAGTVKGHIDNVGFMVGARWGEGVLTLKDGTEKPFKIFGFKALETGLASNDFEGEVYNLKNVDEFPGTWYGASGGVAIIKGKGEITMNNAKCVIIKAKESKEGLEFSAPAAGGVEISWQD